MVDVTPSGKIGVRFLRAWTDTKIDEKTGQTLSRDRIEYSAPGMAHIAATSEYVKLLMKNPQLWPALSPYYEAWQKNNEVPEYGTPLAAWAGVTAREAEVLKTYAVRTVEDISALQDSMIQRIPLPNMRAKKEMAERFLTSADSRKVEQALAAKDQELADLRAKLDNLADMMAEKMDEAEAPRRGPGRPRKEAAEAN